MKKIIQSVFIIALLLQACSVKQQLIQPGSNTNWALESINGEKISGTAKAPTLEFEPDENRVFGFAGCNRFSGQAEITGKTLRFNNLASTKMACPDMKTEDQYLRILSGNQFQYTIAQETLSLSDGTNTLIFKKQAAE